MILKIHFFSTTPDNLEKGKVIWDNEMIPLLKSQKGFYKAFRADAHDGAGGVVIQLWESKQDEEAWRSSPGYEGVYNKLQPFIPELRIERDFEVEKEV